MSRVAQQDPDIQGAPQAELWQGSLPSTCWALSGVALQSSTCIRKFSLSALLRTGLVPLRGLSSSL